MTLLRTVLIGYGGEEGVESLPSLGDGGRVQVRDRPVVYGRRHLRDELDEAGHEQLRAETQQDVSGGSGTDQGPGALGSGEG